MKTIKLFSIFQLGADRVLAIRDQVIKFLASPEKSDYDEIHIPSKLEISEVSVTEDGVLRLNVKTIDDTAFSPDMMLNVIRAVGKTLRDNEEEILNGK